MTATLETIYLPSARPAMVSEETSDRGQDFPIETPARTGEFLEQSKIQNPESEISSRATPFVSGAGARAVGAEENSARGRDLCPLSTPARPGGNTQGRGQKSEASGRNYTDAQWRDAQMRAQKFEEFIRLTTSCHYSLRGAAVAVGLSASAFSGADSMLARYRRGGIAALLPARCAEVGTWNTCDLTKAIEALPWFVPAAQFLYACSNVSTGRGSVPEAVRRTISLPHLPNGWKSAMREKFLASIGCPTCPTCPPELREAVLARQAAGQELVPQRIARQITVSKSAMDYQRNPRDWELNNLSAPGSQRRYQDATGQRVIMLPGDWFGGDDATPGIAVCVPSAEINTPCSQKFGVLLGRFQWLVYHDCRTDKILSWDYVVRPRGSYRAEDILNGMGTVTRTHGIPRQGWQFEGGTFNAKLVKEAIRLMGCNHWRTYSPHQKAIESVFNRVWTKLAVQFPNADMGRFRGENQANCELYEACKKGQRDPRRFFPTIEVVVAAFEEEIGAHNTHPITSTQYGRWVPDEFFAQHVTASPLRPFGREMQWIFSPFAAERKVRSMIVRCRVPMFEDFSVPFEFNADWLPEFDGKLVRMHFDPRQPKCTAKIVLLENCGPHRAGTVLGDAGMIGETSGHIRFILGWAQDNQQAGYQARQRTAGFVRRVTRGVGLNGRAEYTKDEQRDGLGTVRSLETEVSSPESAVHSPAPAASATSDTSDSDNDFRAREAAAEDFESKNALDFY